VRNRLVAECERCPSVDRGRLDVCGSGWLGEVELGELELGQMYVPLDDVDDAPRDLAKGQRLFPFGLCGGAQAACQRSRNSPPVVV